MWIWGLPKHETALQPIYRPLHPLGAWHRGSTLFRGTLNLRKRQKLPHHGLDGGSSIDCREMLATAEAQTHCDGTHGLPLTIDVQR